MTFGLSKSSDLLADAHLACCAVAGVAVVVRIFCKIRHKQGVRIDDWCIIAALLCYYVAVVVVLYGKSLNSPATKTY